jgi:predicted DNA-binding transcriptional regulator AlpA
MQNPKQVETKSSIGRRARLPAPGQRLVGVDAFAEMIGISPAGAYRILRRQELPVVRVGSRTLLAISEIDKFIAARSCAFLDRSE